MNNKKLSIYGVGPLYGIIVIVLTVFGIYSSFNFFSSGVVSNSFLIAFFVIFGFMFMILGLVLWSLAVFGKDSIDSAHLLAPAATTHDLFSLIEPLACLCLTT